MNQQKKRRRFAVMAPTPYPKIEIEDQFWESTVPAHGNFIRLDTRYKMGMELNFTEDELVLIN